MRMLLGFALLAFCGTLAADDKKDEKIDAKKLVGKWETTDKFKATIEYTSDGKYIATLGAGGKQEGTYKLEGNKLTITATVDGKESSRTVTIIKLNDDEMESEGEAGRKSTYKRAKPEKKNEKIDPAKLVGKWAAEEDAVQKDVVLEFTKDGKFDVAGTMNKKAFRIDGTYTLAGNKLTVTAEAGGTEEKSTMTVTTLTDTELVTTDERFGSVNRYTRVKDKK